MHQISPEACDKMHIGHGDKFSIVYSDEDNRRLVDESQAQHFIDKISTSITEARAVFKR
jgi:hypothetical protein